MLEEFDPNSMAGKSQQAAGLRSTIPFESQLLSIGGGFIVFMALVAFLAIHNRKRRNSRDFNFPLIQHSSKVALQKSNNNNLKGRVFPVLPPRRSSHNPSPRQTPSPSTYSLQSPHGSDSSGASPQCTPLTPYSSFGIFDQQIVDGQPFLSAGQQRKHSKSSTESSSGGGGGSSSVGAADAPPQLRQQYALSDNRGSISLQLQYDATTSALQVTILACHELPELMNSPDGQSNLNPYVKLRILPGNQHRVKTRVLRGTKNPFYDETFTMYGINESNVKNYSLHLAVLAFDRYSHDLILGETKYSLAHLDLANNNQKLSTTLKLKARDALGEERGQAMISMAYNAQLNAINFSVLKMKGLPEDSVIGMLDPYAKTYMLVNGQKVAKQKTHVKKKTREPVFNESFNFELGADRSIDTVTFQVSVLNHDGVTRNELIGQFVIDAQSPQLQQIRGSPGQQIAEWYPIQP